MDGNLVLMTGDPLGMTTRVEHVVLRGQHAYDRSKDVRAKYLLEGVQPAGTSAEHVEPVDIHEEEAKAGEKSNGGSNDKKDGQQ